MDETRVDFLIIGAGMAGASIAAHLAERGRVALLESHAHAGYHSTGRSAALFSEIYGSAVIRSLARTSRSFLFDPPSGFAAVPLVRPRPTLYFARHDQLDSLARLRADDGVGTQIRLVSGAEARALIPAFHADYLAGGALETGSADIDVDALLQGYLRLARARGAELHAGDDVTALERESSGWVATTATQRFRAPVVVNAAGAWGDEVARLAGVAPVGLQPMRRTVALVDVPNGMTADAWPAAIDVDEQFYFKPDAGLLLISPADEQLSPPCDAQPEELDIATAADRFEQATATQVRRIKHSWAGLRVFAPDRIPVVGFDPDAEGFFWLVGQGGYGIQTADALGRVAAALACNHSLPDDVVGAGLAPELLGKARFSRTAAANRQS